jgi:hypothetical protein
MNLNRLVDIFQKPETVPLSVDQYFDRVAE